jgi:matrixin/putative Ig domain-containing protein
MLPILITFFSALPSQATTVVRLSDKQLVVTSRVILTGEVRSMVSAWDDAHEMIWTYIEVRRDRVLKGAINTNRVVLKQAGGVVGLEGIEVFGQTRFAPGQKVLLFLNTAPDGSLHVAHSFMGGFTIIQENGRQVATRALEAAQVEILSRNDNEVVTDRAPLEDYVRKIEETMVAEAGAIARVEAEREGQPLVVTPAEYSRKKQGSGGAITPYYQFIGGGVRWMEADSGQPVVFYVNPNQSPVGGGATAELTRGMNAWSQSGAKIQLQLAGQTGNCGQTSNGQNTISFGDCKNQLDPPSGCAGVVAQTQVSFYPSETKVVSGITFKKAAESDIVFNRGMDCFLSTSANLAEVACHELGHAIGLGHTTDASAMMFAVAHGGGRDAVLGSDDVTGILTIYPSSTSGGGGGPSPVNDAANVTQSVPTAMTAGQSYNVSVTMRNNGTTTWAVGLHRLGSQNPQNNSTWGLTRVDLASPVGPGASATFSFAVAAPQAGQYSFQWRMLQEGVGYFGSASQNLTVQVTSASGGGGGGPVAITSLSPDNGVIGRTYSYTMSASGGTPPYRWSVITGALPPGLNLSQTGVIQGVPTTVGTYSFSIQVYDNTSRVDNSDAERLSITVVQSGGSIFPLITRVKIKGEKKLFVYGENFNGDSLILLNGFLLTPKEFIVEDGIGRLYYKGRLNLGAGGTNVLYVITPANRSAGYTF